MTPTWNVWRWFRDGPVAPISAPPASVSGWGALAELEAASALHLRCRALPEGDVEQIADVAARTLGEALDAGAVGRLLAAEWAALATSLPGTAPTEPTQPTLGLLLEAEDQERDAILAWARGQAPGPDPGGAWAGLVSVGGEQVVAVVTEGTNWLPRPPLPAPFYGASRSPALAEGVDPVERPVGWRHHLAEMADLPASWRTDAWFDILGRFGPLAVVLGLGVDDEPLLAQATAGTPFAGPLALTLGEKLALEGVHPGQSSSVRALASELRLDDADLRLFREGRDWLAGEMDLDREVVRVELAEPLRGVVLRGGDASALLDRAGRVGGERLLLRLRDWLVRDGTLTPGEWDALSRGGVAG